MRDGSPKLGNVLHIISKAAKRERVMSCISRLGEG